MEEKEEETEGWIERAQNDEKGQEKGRKRTIEYPMDAIAKKIRYQGV